MAKKLNTVLEPVETTTEIDAPYELLEGWSGKHTFTFEELAQSVEKLLKESYSSAVKAVNRIATVRNYIIGFYIVEYEQNGKARAKYGTKLGKPPTKSPNKLTCSRNPS